MERRPIRPMRETMAISLLLPLAAALVVLLIVLAARASLLS